MNRNQKRILSIFDILGPVMVGPSSNHTAGVLRIGKIARMILGNEPISIELFFYGSLAMVYKDHKSDIGVIAGILGYEIDDPEMINSLEYAKQKKIKIKINTNLHSKRNPNTVEVKLISESFSVKITGISIGGGEIIIEKIDEFNVNFNGTKDILSVFLAKKDFQLIDKILSTLDKKDFSVQSIDGINRKLILFTLNDNIEKIELNFLKKTIKNSEIRTIKSLYTYPLQGSSPLFRTIKEMHSIAKKKQVSLADVVVEYESKRSGFDEVEIRKRVSYIWRVMENSVNEGLFKNNKIITHFISGMDAKMVYKSYKENKTISGDILTLAIARAFASYEAKASMIRTVAAPTAGAVGVLPGVIMTISERFNSDLNSIIDSLLISAGVGICIANVAPVSGAIGGCQSEVGVASAMAASAAVFLAGGNSDKITNAMALALINLMGLACDTISGAPGIPCMLRNTIGVSNALSSAEMAFAGVKSIIPPDEVIFALRNVQTLLPKELRDTTLGGIGVTKTAKRLKEEWNKKILKLEKEGDK